jgi:hypothetical protein
MSSKITPTVDSEDGSLIVTTSNDLEQFKVLVQKCFSKMESTCSTSEKSVDNAQISIDKLEVMLASMRTLVLQMENTKERKEDEEEGGPVTDDAANNLSKRRAALNGDEEILDSLLAISAQAAIAKQEIKQGFKATDKVLDYDITTVKALRRTSSAITKMLLCVTLLGGICVLAILSITIFTNGKDPSDAADSVDIFKKEREEGVKVYLAALSCTGDMGLLVWVLVGLGVPLKNALYCTPPLILAGVFPLIYYALGGEDLNSLSILLVLCVSFAISMATVPDIMYSFRREDGEDVAASVGQRQNAEADDIVVRKEPVKVKTTKERLKIAIRAVMPGFFILALIVFYSIGIFRMSDAMEHNAWKVAVALFALVIKVVGNKLQLRLIAKANMASWVADAMLFAFEFATALMCRLLQLSIPSQSAAQVISLCSAVVEIAVRIFFYHMYIKVWLTKAGKMNKENRLVYQKRGKLRVQDGTNDMVVEYLSSLAAAAMLVFLGATGSFNLSSNGIASSQVWAICAFQLVPEPFLDFYATYMEIDGGLSKFHDGYWSFATGARPGSKFGDLIKTIGAKICISIALIGTVLLVAAR